MEVVEKILNWISQNLLSIFLFGSIFIQISPIKWNPITSFVKWFGKIVTHDLDAKMEEIEDAVGNIVDQVEENEKDRIRWEVLDFANSCRNGRKHTKDEYHHIIALNDKYHDLLNKTGDHNGVFDAEYEYIAKLYSERLEKNDFLS